MKNRLANGFLFGLPLEFFFILLLGTVLRLYQLGDESFWIDEILSLVYANEMTANELIFELPRVDPHPPLYYLLLRLWLHFPLVSPSETGIRLLSALFGIATIPVLYFFTRDIFDQVTANFATLFVAVNPLQIWYAQEARMYTAFIFFTVLSFYSLVLFIRSDSMWATMAYVFTATLVGYIHAFGLFILFAQALFLLWVTTFHRRTFSLSFRETVGVLAGLGLALSPWLIVLFVRTFLSEATANQTIWIQPPSLYTLWQTFSLLVFGHADIEAYESLSAPPTFTVFIAACCVAIIVLRGQTGGIGINRAAEIVYKERPMLLLAILWFLIPIVVPYLVSILIMPIYAVRYTIVSAPAALLLIARAVRTIKYIQGRHLLIVILLFGMLVPLPGYYMTGQNDEWREATESIDSRSDSDDAILLVPDWSEPAFQYYFGEEGIDVRPEIVVSEDESAVHYHFDEKNVEIYGVAASASADEMRTRIDGKDEIFVVVSELMLEEEQEAALEQINEAIGEEPTEEHKFLNIRLYIYSSNSNGTENSNQINTDNNLERSHRRQPGEYSG